MDRASVELIFLHCGLLSLDLPLVITNIEPRRIRVEFISERSCVVVVNLACVAVGDFDGLFVSLFLQIFIDFLLLLIDELLHD